jgi:hypothetical protein
MAENVAASGPVADSPHVLAATNTRRGMTPAVWEDAQGDDYAGVWTATDPGGPADRSGNMTGGFDSGPDRWTQI